MHVRHANIFLLLVKWQLSWIFQITWIYDIHLCITIQSNSQNIKPCSISNSLLTQCSACGRQSVFGRSRNWRMLGFCLSEYCDFIQQGIPPAMLVWRITCVEIYWGRMNWKEEATVLCVYIRENVSKLWNVCLIQLFFEQYNSKLWPVLAQAY
jgi:hypothetical protein